MIKPNNDALLGQQAQAETASEIQQSTDADAEHREAIAGISKGLSQALAGRGLRQDAFSKTWRRLEGRIFTSSCLLFDGLPYFDLERGDV